MIACSLFGVLIVMVVWYIWGCISVLRSINRIEDDIKDILNR